MKQAEILLTPAGREHVYRFDAEQSLGVVPFSVVAPMSKEPTPFPTLTPDAFDPWQWPEPPFAWRHRPAPGVNTLQPCQLESQGGATVQGEMLGFDPAARTLSFRTQANGPTVSLSFSRFRRLTLTTPLQPTARTAGAPLERVPAAAQEREYRLRLHSTSQQLTGRTAGHVEMADGMYLFTPVDDEASVQRVFVPRTAYSQCEFGPSAEEIAARQWIASPRELLDAIERQQRMPVRPIGQSLLDLGLLTKDQLDRALARQSKDKPLGETLVAAGMLSRADLQTALAHKMGFPLVDLARFPIQRTAVAKLPARLAVAHRTMPLMLDKQRLIVAVDKPSRVVKLRAAHGYAEMAMVPVLASKSNLMAALTALSQDVWSGHVAERVPFFATTI